MKHKKIILPALGLICSCMMGCVAIYQLLIHECLWWECAPPRTFDVLDLGLPSTLFPAEAQFFPIQSDRNCEAIRCGVQTVYWGNRNGLGIYLVERYATIAKAEKEYAYTRNYIFEDQTTKFPWNEYVLVYKSSAADQFYSACGILTGRDYRCILAAQYQEFFVFFNTTITKDMSHADFQRVVVLIDDQMDKHLHGK